MRNTDFEVSVPKSWTYKKAVQSDPEEGMRNGEASFSILAGGTEEEPENWNAIVFNSSGSSDNPLPYISISAHCKPGQTPEEYAKLFESTVTGYRGKISSANTEFNVGDAKGFDYIYTLFVQRRYSALYKNGTRVFVHYFSPANDPSLFEKYTSEVDEVIQSIKIK